jgi:hypothetical protein
LALNMLAGDRNSLSLTDTLPPPHSLPPVACLV